MVTFLPPETSTKAVLLSSVPPAGAGCSTLPAGGLTCTRYLPPLTEPRPTATLPAASVVPAAVLPAASVTNTEAPWTGTSTAAS